MAKTISTPEQQTFESAIERLEAIVEKMEAEKLPLEELIVRYEEGVKLVKFCSEKLAAAEKRIEIISRDGSGKAEVIPFEEDVKATADARDEIKLL